MHCRIVHRAIRFASACLFVASCGPWTPGAFAATPQQDSAQPAAGAAGAATPAATDQTPAAADSPTPDATARAVRSGCEKAVAVLAGQKDDAAAFSKPEVQKLGPQLPDLVTCGAVLRDSDAACKRFMPLERGPGKMCNHMRSMFNELRAYPKGRSFMFDQVEWDEWQSVPELRPLASPFRDALRSGDATECAKTGDLDSMCRAYLTLDASLCQIGGKLGTVEFQLPQRKAGEPAKQLLKPVLEAACKDTIESRAFLAKGLEAVADSGQAREREFAKAALHQPDACQAFLQQGVDLCATSRQPVAGTPAPATPPQPPPAMP